MKTNCKLWVFVVQKQRPMQTTHFRCMSFLRLANQKISIVYRLLYSFEQIHRGRHTSRDQNDGKCFVCISIFIGTTSFRTIFSMVIFCLCFFIQIKALHIVEFASVNETESQATILQCKKNKNRLTNKVIERKLKRFYGVCELVFLSLRVDLTLGMTAAEAFIA